jgi:DNA replication protein DnaC
MGCGMYDPDGRGVRWCECRRREIRRQRLAGIPPKFAAVTLETLEPKLKVHADQERHIPYIKANPLRSYLLAGTFGTGKTWLMWALYRHAIDRDVTGLVVCTLSELLNEYKAFIQASMERREDKKYPRIGAETLRQNHTKYSIFLDDVDKAKPTEYAAEQLFELVDAIYSFGHQLVVTTNLRPAALVKHFERADDRFGGAIVRRITDGAKICEMF